MFVTDYLVQGGRPVLDAHGRVIPVFQPGLSQAWQFTATRGATVDIRTGNRSVLKYLAKPVYKAFGGAMNER